MHIDRKQIMEGFIRILNRISDDEYQKRIWIRGEGPEWDSFDDTVNSYSLESEGILDKYKEFGLTESQYILLKKFSEEFGAFSRENDLPEEFISMPQWKKIMEMAKEVLKAFNYQKK